MINGANQRERRAYTEQRLQFEANSKANGSAGAGLILGAAGLICAGVAAESGTVTAAVCGTLAGITCCFAFCVGTGCNCGTSSPSYSYRTTRRLNPTAFPDEAPEAPLQQTPPASNAM